MSSRLGRENTPQSIAVLVVLLAVLGGAGYRLWGGLGGLFGALVATSIALVGTAMFRAVAGGKFTTKTAISLEGLDGRQSLAVLGQYANADAPQIRSVVLDGVAEIESLAEDDFASARVRAEALMHEHPRSPAVPAALARLLRARDDARADAQSSVAIELAIVGGMNGVAVTCFDECPPEHRERLQLTPATWAALERALAVRGRSSDAEFASARAESTAELAAN